MMIGTNPLSIIIKEELLSQQGYLSFARFMELALYHPQYGYYNKKDFTIGKTGDFTTAPEISSLFAQCFATQIKEIMATLATTAILELGAGTGRFAGDLLQELEKLHALPKHYYIYEISASLRAKQKEYLSIHCKNITTSIIWLDELPQQLNGIIIANEVLDALPVNCFHIAQDSIKERCVSEVDGELAWSLQKPSELLLAEATQLKQMYGLPSGYESEINLTIDSFLHSLANCLDKGVLLFADYGYGQCEYYHPQRQQGTLTCFYQHHHHANPLIMPGEQDITAHVDFTRVVDKAIDYGCKLLGFTDQASFLLSTGLIERAIKLEPTLAAQELFALQQQIKTLTMPTEMGERIKILALAKNCEISLSGFTMQDRRREL